MGATHNERKNVISYQVTVEGITPLLMHRDNIEFSDAMRAWREDPKNKKSSVAGDDRSPAHTWLGCLYEDDEGYLAVPSENIMRCLMEGGAQVPVPGQARKTFKAQTQSGMLTAETAWAVLVDGNKIPMSALTPLMKVGDFTEHIAKARSLGFDLFTKRAKIGQSKHVRVRPKFPRWSLRGRLDVWDDQLTREALNRIWEYAGDYKGLCDWRPGSKTPGPFGRFRATLEKL